MRLFAAVVALIAFADAAFSQQNLTADDIIKGLGGQPAPSAPSAKPKGDMSVDDMVSALGGGQAAPAAKGPVARGLGDEEIKKLTTRGFNLREEELKKVEKVSEGRPKLDLEVYFDYNSAEITPQARYVLDKLGTALQHPSLAGLTFLFNGHTDKRGNPKYNEELSFRRARSVQRYIVENFKVDERHIIASGHGSRVPKNPANPYADENRRVEIARAN